MHYVIYIDVLFVVNFIMDYVILSITVTILTHITTLPEVSGSRNICKKYIKRIVASILGATWGITVVMFGLRQWGFTIITYMLIGPAMLAITTGQQKLLEFAKGVLVMYVATFVLGGVIHVIYYYSLIGYYVHNLLANQKNAISIWIFIPGIIFSYVLIRCIVEYVGERRSQKGLLCTAVITNEGKSISLPAFYDTGNSLKDPIYGEWVHVVLADSIKELVSGNNSYHLIPYSSIGNDNGLIPVVRMEKLQIICEQKAMTVERPLFALYSGRFSHSTPYRVILNPMVGFDNKT